MDPNSLRNSTFTISEVARASCRRSSARVPAPKASVQICAEKLRKIDASARPLHLACQGQGWTETASVLRLLRPASLGPNGWVKTKQYSPKTQGPACCHMLDLALQVQLVSQSNQSWQPGSKIPEALHTGSTRGFDSTDIVDRRLY